MSNKQQPLSIPGDLVDEIRSTLASAREAILLARASVERSEAQSFGMKAPLAAQAYLLERLLALLMPEKTTLDAFEAVVTRPAEEWPVDPRMTPENAMEYRLSAAVHVQWLIASARARLK